MNDFLIELERTGKINVFIKNLTVEELFLYVSYLLLYITVDISRTQGFNDQRVDVGLRGVKINPDIYQLMGHILNPVPLH